MYLGVVFNPSIKVVAYTVHMCIGFGVSNLVGVPKTSLCRDLHQIFRMSLCLPLKDLKLIRFWEVSTIVFGGLQDFDFSEA